jgi:hypothetical protein
MCPPRDGVVMSQRDVLLVLEFLRRVVVHGSDQDELLALVARLEALVGIRSAA